MICKKGKAYITAAMLDNIASPSSVLIYQTRIIQTSPEAPAWREQ